MWEASGATTATFGARAAPHILRSITELTDSFPQMTTQHSMDCTRARAISVGSN